MNKKNRKTKGFSHRLVALLLCCACLFSVTPISAIALGEEAAPAASVAEAQPEEAAELQVAEPEAEAEPEEPAQQEEPAEPEAAEAAEAEEAEAAPAAETADSTPAESETAEAEQQPAAASEAAESEAAAEADTESQPADSEAAQSEAASQPAESEAAESEPETEATEADKLYERLMACTTYEEMQEVLNGLIEEEQALLDDFTEEQNAALEAKTEELGGYEIDALDDTVNDQYTIPAGSSITRKFVDNNHRNFEYSGFTVTFEESSDTNVDVSLIQVTDAGSSNYTISVKDGAAPGKYTVTVNYRYRQYAWQSWTTISETIRVVVPEPSTDKIKVYVYVSGASYSDEMLDLLGINPETKDSNGYFPAGIIELDKSWLDGKDSTSEGIALIQSNEDWVSLKKALHNMDVSNFYDMNGVTYTANKGNNVPNYIEQAECEPNKTWGQQATALFHWHTVPANTPDGAQSNCASGLPYHYDSTHYGFADQNSVKYHLDLKFSTKEITFICGNNGIDYEPARDGTIVDSRTYITGSPIQPPRNLQVPAGYQLVGYYTDADFKTPWNGINTPLNEDQIVYIKIAPLDNVVIRYEVAQGNGRVSRDNEALNPETGEVKGSEAQPDTGWVFEGWYRDKGCTDKIETGATFVPTKPGDRWTNATYYAKFVPKTVQLTIKKIVSGNMGDQNKEFNFTVDGTSVKEADKSFKLKHNDTQKITVNVGDKITVSEVPEGYVASYQIGDNENPITEDTATVTAETVTDYVVTSVEGQTIVFTNRKDVTIDTGVVLDTLPYVLILAVVAGGAVLMVKKRGKRDSD